MFQGRLNIDLKCFKEDLIYIDIKCFKEDLLYIMWNPDITLRG